MQNSPVSANNNRKWINGLDSIRIVLAVIVMFGHMPDFLKAYEHSHSSILRLTTMAVHQLFCGPAAVITFFILSGFVIHFPNRNKESFDVVSFLIRRVLRIGLPLAVVMLVGNYFGLVGKIPVWSLYCELAYYIVYPLFFKLKIGWYKLFLVSFVISYLLIFILNWSSVLSLLQHKDINFRGEYWQLGIFLTIVIGFPSWLLGVLLAEKIDNLNYTISYKTLLLYRISIYIVSCILLIGVFHFYLSYMISLNLFAFFAVKWIEKEIVYYQTHACNPVLEYMGKFSYTLYLWHGLLIVGLTTAGLNSLKPQPLAYITYPVCIIALAYILYLIIEYPSHKLAVRASNAVVKAKKA